MKNKNVKNLRVLTASLCLGATLLTGCGHDANIYVGDSNIDYYYDDNQIEGKITFGDLNEYGKLVVLKDNGEKFIRLLIKEKIIYDGGYDSLGAYNRTTYKDLETGATIIDCYDYVNLEKETWKKGEDLEIVSEVGINSYLVNNNYVKTDYTVEEVMTFFYDTILPSLDLSEKELVK